MTDRSHVPAYARSAGTASRTDASTGAAIGVGGWGGERAGARLAAGTWAG